MIGKLCTLALVALGLLALTGCGTGAEPTVSPAASTAAPAVTPNGTVGLGATPLAMATSTPTGTRPAGTVPAGATVTASAMTPAATATPGATMTPATTATSGAAMTPAATNTVATGGLEPPQGTPTTGATTPAATNTVPTGGLEPPQSTPAATSTAASAATAAATPTGVEVVVISFNVWQDFMPGTNSGGPPLYASVELNLINHGTTPVHAVLASRIVVRRPEGDVLLDRGLQGGPPDTVAGTDLAPGETRHYSYRSTSSDVSPTMTENEAVSGSLTLSLDGAEQTIPLPATRVLFTQ